MNVYVLSGVKPSGPQIHLGNYIGAIKPIKEILQNEKNKTVLLFIADYHALTSHISPEELSKSTKDLMISYLAIFDTLHKTLIKNNNTVYTYRQSKVPEIFELYWILSCYTAKGLLNRNHTYKQETEINISKGKDPDKGIFAGIFNYPVLMAADILLFGADFVPVGKDQLQHVEIANDIANKINHVYKSNILSLTTPIINQENYILPGKDGNKMSKSYDNTVPLFSSDKNIHKYVYGIKTNNKGDGEPKSPAESDISDLYKAFSTKYQYEKFVEKMESGESWKDLKTIVYTKIINEIKEYKENYDKHKDNMGMVINRFELNERFIRTIAKNNLNRIKKNIGMEV